MVVFIDPGEGVLTVIPKSKVAVVRVSGPLAPFVGDFRAWLSERGYTPLTVVIELRLMAHLSRWMHEQGFGPGELTGQRLRLFLDAQRAGGYGVACTLARLRPLVETLRALGVVQPEPVRAGSPSSEPEALLEMFRVYLLGERGLAASTAQAYVLRARRFLTRDVPGRGLAAVSAGDVTGAVMAESGLVSVGSTQVFVVALRAFLRFCFIQALIPVDFSGAVLAITGRPSFSLPRGITQASVRALLGSCDRRTAQGRRDYAIILILVRLGLRAGEVAALVLEDIDWRAGQIVVHGKGARIDVLPLPGDVGEAIVGYLQRGRAVTTGRNVFLRSTAPIGPLGGGGVSFVVRRACRRARIPEIGAHRLRHTAACQMVAAGISLVQIGQVLRHRSLISTAIYARLDVEALRGLAQPWPGGGSR